MVSPGGRQQSGIRQILTTVRSVGRTRRGHTAGTETRQAPTSRRPTPHFRWGRTPARPSTSVARRTSFRWGAGTAVKLLFPPARWSSSSAARRGASTCPQGLRHSEKKAGLGPRAKSIVVSRGQQQHVASIFCSAQRYRTAAGRPEPRNVIRPTPDCTSPWPVVGMISVRPRWLRPSFTNMTHA